MSSHLQTPCRPRRLESDDRNEPSSLSCALHPLEMLAISTLRAIFDYFATLKPPFTASISKKYRYGIWRFGQFRIHGSNMLHETSGSNSRFYILGLKMVGGLKHFLFFHILGIINHPNWRSPSFFRGVGLPPNQSSGIQPYFAGIFPYIGLT